jgi:hypothetical protein
MPQSNRPEASQLIYAQVVVRPDNGDSLLSSSVLIDSKNVSQFHAASDRVELVVRKLKEAGFEVLSTHVTQKPKKVSETAIPSEIAAKP